MTLVECMVDLAPNLDLNTITCMKTISLSVSEPEYEAYRTAAGERGTSIAHLIREAMSYYRAERIATKTALIEVPVLVGHRPVAALPQRHAVYEEIFGDAIVVDAIDEAGDVDI